MKIDTVVMVDWSGGNDTGRRPRKDAIWAAVAREGEPAIPRLYLRNREVAVAWLGDLLGAEIRAGRRVLAGFDFPFGYPAGFAARLTGRADPLAVWGWMADHLEDAPKGNNRFDLAGRINAMFPGVGPFWFNASAREIDHLPRKGRARDDLHGMPERRAVEERAKGSFTCWQMGGAGAVGSQVMTGMAALERLRRAFPGQVAVWPFEPLDRPVALVEVWPSLLDRAVKAATGAGDIRDAVQVRVLARAVAGMAAAGTLPGALAAVPEAARAEEGWILGVGAEEALAAGLR
jgi:molybdopterin molybdotransferase